MKPTFYIAGPMRGVKDYNFPAFDAARDFGKARGYEIVSPADIDRRFGIHENTPGVDTLQMSRLFAERDTNVLIRQLAAENGDGIALLPGWEASTGAVAEFFIARWVGLRVFDATTFRPFTKEAIEKISFEAVEKAIRRTLFVS